MTSDAHTTTGETPRLGRIAEAQARYAAAQAARRMAYTAYRDADGRRWDARQRPTPRPAGVEASVLVAARQAGAQAAEVDETEATLLQWARRERHRVAHELDALRQQVRTREADVEAAERQLARALAELEALGDLGGPDA